MGDQIRSERLTLEVSSRIMSAQRTGVEDPAEMRVLGDVRFLLFDNLVGVSLKRAVSAGDCLSFGMGGCLVKQRRGWCHGSGADFG